MEQTAIKLQSIARELKMPDFMTMTPSDIELDMTSPDELVEFRDLLAKKERLDIDVIGNLIHNSSAWWSDMNS